MSRANVVQALQSLLGSPGCQCHGRGARTSTRHLHGTGTMDSELTADRKSVTSSWAGGLVSWHLGCHTAHTGKQPAALSPGQRIRAPGAKELQCHLWGATRRRCGLACRTRVSYLPVRLPGPLLGTPVSSLLAAVLRATRAPTPGVTPAVAT